MAARQKHGVERKSSGTFDNPTHPKNVTRQERKAQMFFA